MLPAGGPTETMEYDGVGRIFRVTNTANGASTRWEYPAAMNIRKSYTTVVAGTELYSVEYYDGAGRVRATASQHPGSVGGFRGVHLWRDSMGRVIYTSNPTEITDAWATVGDDQPAGMRVTYQTYDWQGRPLETTSTDGSTRGNEYGGCGCAGGEVATVRDERGRRKRYTQDVLGRLVKTEELNWDTSVYAASIYSYNARDQLTQINGAGQTRSMAYDGHGRLSSRTTPEQGTTTWSYNPNDTTNIVTDARGATQTFGYNNRHMVTAITYGVPAGVAATAPVTFGYDGAGNRTGMTDGMGSVAYGYDQLSRLTSETRTFDGVGTFNLSYGYNLAGDLTSLTNHWGAQVTYNRDAAGQVVSVGGSGYGGIAAYAYNLQYRNLSAKWILLANSLLSC